MNLSLPMWSLTHKTLSYLGSPVVPTNLPAGDAMPVFSTKELAEKFIESGADKAYGLEANEIKTPSEFEEFLETVSRMGIQYGANNPNIGEVCHEHFRIGVLLHQFRDPNVRKQLGG